MFVSGSLRVGKDYRIDICSKLALAGDGQTVRFDDGGQFNLVSDSGSVGKQTLLVVAIYAVL